jgi:hypothetical protein
LMHGEPLGPVQWLAMGCSAAAMWLALFKPMKPADVAMERA